MNKQTIRIKYFTDKIEKLTYIDGKSDWIDLRAADDLCLKKGDFALVPLGNRHGTSTRIRSPCCSEKFHF